MLPPIISVWVKFIKNSTYFLYVVQVQLSEKNCLIYFKNSNWFLISAVIEMEINGQWKSK